jgi:hypothetical protein
MAESTLAKGPNTRFCLDTRHHIRCFYAAFPGQLYPLFYHQLESIAERKLSIAERDAIIRVCRWLTEKKHNVKTADDLKRKLAGDNETKKRFIAAKRKLNLLAKQAEDSLVRLSIGIYNMSMHPYVRDYSDARELSHSLRELLDRFPSAPLELPVLGGIIALTESEQKIGRGPPPDAEFARTIKLLEAIWGKEITAGYNASEGRRTSPFIEFVKTILRALPHNALIGREGIYTDAAIEEHINRRRNAKRGRGKQRSSKTRKSP